MIRLPQPGGDKGQWGDILNAYLLTAHNTDGTLKIDAVPVNSVAGKTGAVTLTKSDVGLESIDNTSDANKPISAVAQAALDLKEAVANKSTNTSLGTSDTLYPSQNAVKEYVDVGITGIPRVYNVLEGVRIGGVLTQVAGDGTTDDAAVLQEIMDYISDQGGGIMWFPPATYMIRSSVWIRSHVTVDGVPGSSILTSDVDGLLGIFRSDQQNEVYDFTVRNIKFLGNVTEEPTVPQADRTRDPSPFHAIKVNGSFAPETDDDFGQPTSGPVIQNVTLDNITVQNMASLPITLFGVTGKCIVRGCEFRNCKDPGWVYNEEVVCIGNHSIYSNDNGFSLSRGNRKVVCVGNTVENAALFGIWLSGYNEDIGPTEFTCTGNTVINTGRSCINLDFGPSKGVISGNYLYQGHHRGPFDAVSDSGIDGITITGASGGVHATNLLIEGNVIEAAARNGITLKECDNTLISNNIIINPGTQYKANGTTEILAGDLLSNHGICTITLNTYTNVRILNNYLVENRATPLGNWPIYKVNTSGTKAYGNKHTTGWRNNVNELDIIDSAISGAPIDLNVNGGNGTDGGDANVDVRLNMQGSGKFHVRNADGSGFNIHSTSTSSAAKATLLMSAGALASYAGAITAGRQDASSSSIIAFRPLRNSLLASDGTAAPFWIKGLPANTRAVLGLMGGQATQRTAVSDANYTVLAIDYIISYTSLSTGRTVTLKDATILDAGQTYIIKDETGLAGTNNLTIGTSASQTIDGASSKVININYGQIALHSDGANWHVIGGVYNTSQLATVTDATAASKGIVQLTNDFGGTAAAPTVVATHLVTALPINQGGTGSTTQNFVDLTNTQTIAGTKTFANTIHSASAGDPLRIIGAGTANPLIRFFDDATERGAIFSVNANTDFTVRSQADLVLTGHFGGTPLSGRFTSSGFGIATSPTSTLHVAGSFAAAITNKTSNYTLTAADYTVTGNAAGGAFNFTLPSAAGIAGRMYLLKKTDASGNALTVNTTSSQTIDGSTTHILNAQYKYVMVQSDGANWVIIGNN